MTRTRRARGWVVAAVGTVVLAGLHGAAPEWVSDLAPRLAAQQPAQSAPADPSQANPQQTRPPAFRAGVNFVSVDVFPRRDGQVVPDLTRDDFQILEDGQPQAVETFEFVQLDSLAIDEERRDPSSLRDAEAQAADPHNRVFVIYLDLAHTTVLGSHAARQPVVDFLTRTIGATDVFAVMTAEVPVGQMTFGRRTDVIEDQLARHSTWGLSNRLVVTPRTPYEQRLVQECISAEDLTLWERLVMLSREDALQTSLEGLMQRLGSLRDERKNILFISEGWEPLPPQEQLLQHVRGDVPSIGIGTPTSGRVAPGSRPQGNADRSWCDQEILRLASIDFEDRFRRLLADASRANVTFYPVDVGGLKTGMADASMRTTDEADAAARRGRQSLDTLRTLAKNTDGFAVVDTNDLSAGVRRIQDDLASYYLLGYYSTNATPDGRYRRIEVKVNAPGVSVSARRGYFAPTAEGLASVEAAAAGPTPVELELTRLDRLRAEAELFSYGVPTATGLDVFVELPRQAARQQFEAGAAVEVAARAGGAELTATGRIDPGTRGAIVHVPDADSGETWRVDVTVTGDGATARDQIQIGPAPRQLVGLSRPFRATPSPRSPLHPVADLQLARTERLHVEWPVLAAGVTGTARLLGRDGQPLGPDLPLTTPVDREDVLVLDLPLASFPGGDFVVELTASSPDGGTERRLFAFRVTR